MKFDDIHGTDWIFTNPEDGERKSFPYSGYGAKREDRLEAETFASEHPDWVKTVESF